MRVLIAIPVYNEERHVERVLTEVRRHGEDILVVNDGSTDGSPALLARQADLHLITHRRNLGYYHRIEAIILAASRRDPAGPRIERLAVFRSPCPPLGI